MDKQDRHPSQAREEASFRFLMEQIPAVLWTTDLKLNFTLSLGSGLKGLGLAPNQVVGMSLYEYMQSEDPQFLPISSHLDALKGKSSTYEFEWQGRFFHTHVEPLHDQDGKITGTIGVALDITDRKQAEEALRRASLELERSNRELEQFAYSASHDLQEPLHKIIGFGDRIQQLYHTLLDERGKDYLHRMQKAAGGMRVLIEDLLQFARITTHAKTIEEVELNSLFEEVLSDLEIRIAESGGTVEVGELPTLAGDRLQLHQLFQNLIGNALKFRNAERPPRVVVRSQKIQEGWVEISVSDNGIGFEEEYLDKIFKPFQRLHLRSAYEGSGMGLTLCQKIVHRHGGEITGKSLLGKGSTFVVKLPLRVSEEGNQSDGESK